MVICADLSEDEPDFDPNMETVPSSFQILSWWLLHFLMFMQAVFHFSDVVTTSYISASSMFSLLSLFSFVLLEPKLLKACLLPCIYPGNMTSNFNFGNMLFAKNVTEYTIFLIVLKGMAGDKAKCAAFVVFHLIHN